VTKRRLVLGALFIALAAARLCHVRILWPDGDYHLAAARQIVQGSVIYRDFWFDKPPLGPLLHVLFGARAGAPLMLGSAAYLWLACLAAYFLARRLWSEAEGLLAAGLLSFHLIFYLPSAVIPLPVDAAMLAPHLAAVGAAVAGWPFMAGAASAVAFFFNVKGVFVLAAVLIWLPDRRRRAVAGFVSVCILAAGALAAAGALPGYIDQVWRWGIVYAGSSPEAHPYVNGLTRTANWLGFHAAITLGALCFFWKERGSFERRAAAWFIISAAAVALGLRFAPRYFFQWLPVVILLGARGLRLAYQQRPRLTAIAACLLLLVPAARFGPRYFLLAADLTAGRPHAWRDIRLDQDSRQATRIIRRQARPAETLLVWGYRPGIFVYTGLKAGSRFLDSQPLTGVPAERHFYVSTPVDSELARANRAELRRSSPTFIVDALGFANPGLAINRFEDLKPWLDNYEIVAQTELSRIYRRKPGTQEAVR